MKIPLSRFGITKEERTMMSNRLNPLVNDYFLKKIAEQNNLKFYELEDLDYEDNEVFKAEQFNKKRELNASRNIPINKDAGTTEYEYKTFEEAKYLDKKSKHILLEDDHKRGRYEPIDEDDEKIPDAPKLQRQDSRKNYDRSIIHGSGLEDKCYIVRDSEEEEEETSEEKCDEKS